MRRTLALCLMSSWSWSLGAAEQSPQGQAPLPEHILYQQRALLGHLRAGLDSERFQARVESLVRAGLPRELFASPEVIRDSLAETARQQIRKARRRGDVSAEVFRACHVGVSLRVLDVDAARADEAVEALIAKMRASQDSSELHVLAGDVAQRVLSAEARRGLTAMAAGTDRPKAYYAIAALRDDYHEETERALLAIYLAREREPEVRSIAGNILAEAAEVWPLESGLPMILEVILNPREPERVRAAGAKLVQGRVHFDPNAESALAEVLTRRLEIPPGQQSFVMALQRTGGLTLKYLPLFRQIVSDAGYHHEARLAALGPLYRLGGGDDGMELQLRLLRTDGSRSLRLRLLESLSALGDRERDDVLAAVDSVAKDPDTIVAEVAREVAACIRAWRERGKVDSTPCYPASSPDTGRGTQRGTAR